MPAANFLRSGKASSFTDDNRDNAFQTHRLALNATAEVAKNTAGLIEGTIKKIKDGSDLVAETNEVFTEVSERSSKVGELVAEISAASNEQACLHPDF